jgi:hypothetical protein
MRTHRGAPPHVHLLTPEQNPPGVENCGGHTELDTPVSRCTVWETQYGVRVFPRQSLSETQGSRQLTLMESPHSAGAPGRRKQDPHALGHVSAHVGADGGGGGDEAAVGTQLPP